MPTTALAAAASIGYPVVIKTDQPGIAHKSDAGGVILGIASPGELTAAYTDLAARLGPAALICETVPQGTELALGLIRDPDLGPLIVVGAGGTLVELIADRAVALPPVSSDQASGLLAELKVSALLAGARGAPPADLAAIASAITGLAELAHELGQDIDALDINPLICGPDGAIAVDALVIPGSLGLLTRATPGGEPGRISVPYLAAVRSEQVGPGLPHRRPDAEPACGLLIVIRRTAPDRH